MNSQRLVVQTDTCDPVTEYSMSGADDGQVISRGPTAGTAVAAGTSDTAPTDN